MAHRRSRLRSRQPPKAARRPRRSTIYLLVGLAGLLLAGWAGWRRFQQAEPPDAVAASDSLERLEPEVRRLVEQQRQRIAAAPQLASQHGELGTIYEANGIWAEARRAYERAVQLDPRNRIWRLHLATAAERDGDAQTARRILRELADEYPNYAPAQHRAGYGLLEAGELSEASGAFQRVIEALPDHAAGYVGLADVRLREDRPDDALRLLDQALQRDAKHRVAHYLRGSALRQLGKQDEALRELKLGEGAELEYLSDELTPQLQQYAVNVRSRLKQGVRLMVEGKFEEAARVLEAARQADPQNVTVLNDLAGTYVRTGRVDDAEPLLLRALELDPQKYTTYVNLASWNLYKGRLDVALEYAEGAVQRAPWIAMTHRVRITTLMQMKRYPEARAALTQAEAAAPNSPYWKPLAQQLAAGSPPKRVNP